MNWLQLLSSKRRGDDSRIKHDGSRSRFEQDYDRIIFSQPFRRLQDKTQVFPLPEDDFVHNRLTHSLEVSSVGRSLGKKVGSHVLEHSHELVDANIRDSDFGAIVGAACLAHDLGNPPFGHSGEDSISTFFMSEAGNSYQEKMSKEEWTDLTNFEGNAQGFRILNAESNGGLKLTFAALGAFTKYPLSSSSPKEKGRKSQKKYGYYQSDSILFEQVVNEMGLVNLSPGSWSRHPLAFLVEAADDICYHIIDLEDGCRLGLVSFEEVKDLLATIIGDNFSSEKLRKIPTLNQKIGTLRALAINQLINECVEVFNTNEAGILAGQFDQSLTSLIPSAKALNEIIQLSIDKIYRSKIVLEKEAGGYEIIDALMKTFSESVYHSLFESALPKHKAIFRLIPEEYGHQLNSNLSVYQSMQVVTDFISGLTDSHAVRLYRTIKGYRLNV